MANPILKVHFAHSHSMRKCDLFSCQVIESAKTETLLKDLYFIDCVFGLQKEKQTNTELYSTPEHLYLKFLSAIYLLMICFMCEHDWVLSCKSG